MVSVPDGFSNYMSNYENTHDGTNNTTKWNSGTPNCELMGIDYFVSIQNSIIFRYVYTFN